MKNLRVTHFLVLAALLPIGVGGTACGPAGSATPDATTTVFAAPGLPVAAPEAVGMSSARLERLSTAMQQLVDEGRLAGRCAPILPLGLERSQGVRSNRGGQFWALSVDTRSERQLTDLTGKCGASGSGGVSTDGRSLYFPWTDRQGDIWVMDVVQDDADADADGSDN